MFFRYTVLLFFLLLTFFETVQQAHPNIKGPTDIKGYIGEDAYFMWNTTNQQELRILSVSWGIRKDNIADPLFINVNGYTGKVTFSKDLDDTIKRRVDFHGDLKKGFAWFVLRNLTANDTNEYIASISDNVPRVLAYPVRLVVARKRKVKPTTGPSVSTDTTAVSPSMTSNPQFTRNPQSVYHVSSGSTSRLVWDPYVKNRIAHYLAYTMRWSLDDRNGGAVVIGGFTGSKFVTSKDCPARLRGRVSKESIATLVISNVTTADSGIYSFHMRWRSISVSNLKISARLIVTTAYNKTTISPNITTAYNKTTISPNITTPEPSSTNTIRQINVHLMAIALVMSHF